MMTSELIHALYGNIFEMLKIGELPSDKKKEILVKIEEVMYDRLLLRIIEKLEESDKQKFADLISREEDKVNEEELLSFITEKVPDFLTFLEEEIASFKFQLMKSVENDEEDLALARLEARLESEENEEVKEKESKE